MSSSSTSALAGGVQQLYNDGLLSNVNPSTLNGASASQLNQIAGSSIALQIVGAILGFGSDSSGDSASLSATASNALLQEINPSSTSSTSSNSNPSTDPLTAAVDNALTSNINAAVNRFAPQSSSITGSNINVLG